MRDSYLSRRHIGPALALWRVLLTADFQANGNEPPWIRHSKQQPNKQNKQMIGKFKINTKLKHTQPKLLERSFPVPSGIIATGGTGSRPCLLSSPTLPSTQPTVPSPPATYKILTKFPISHMQDLECVYIYIHTYIHIQIYKLTQKICKWGSNKAICARMYKPLFSSFDEYLWHKSHQAQPTSPNKPIHTGQTHVVSPLINQKPALQNSLNWRDRPSKHSWTKKFNRNLTEIT